MMSSVIEWIQSGNKSKMVDITNIVYAFAVIINCEHILPSLPFLSSSISPSHTISTSTSTSNIQSIQLENTRLTQKYTTLQKHCSILDETNTQLTNELKLMEKKYYLLQELQIKSISEQNKINELLQNNTKTYENQIQFLKEKYNILKKSEKLLTNKHEEQMKK
jgi:predicted unusual protein kinase regulating ubiquinone biosynthesis (AarF/ABC1/UbiB family)